MNDHHLLREDFSRTCWTLFNSFCDLVFLHLLFLLPSIVVLLNVQFNDFNPLPFPLLSLQIPSVLFLVTFHVFLVRKDLCTRAPVFSGGNQLGSLIL